MYLDCLYYMSVPLANLIRPFTYVAANIYRNINVKAIINNSGKTLYVVTVFEDRNFAQNIVFILVNCNKLH